MTTVVKLGGSVITAKKDRETLDDRSLSRAAGAIAEADEEVAVVHGAGSFGHPHAAEYGVTETTGTHDYEAVTAIHGAVTTLTRFVVSRLHAADAPAVPVHPLSAGYRNEGGETRLPTGAVETLLSEGFLPVTHGDGVAHVGEGTTVVSGDELVVALARAVNADRVGLCSAVPGVLDDDGNVIDRIDSFDSVASVFGENPGADVTGGMAGKVQRSLGLDAPAFVFGLDELKAFLDGRDAGTRIE